MAKWRPYDPTLRADDVELLYDADEYFPDIVEELKGVTEPTLLITGWVIHPAISLAPDLTLEQLIVDVLTRNKASCYILWNSNTTGPAPQLLDRVREFWRRVSKKIGGDAVAAERLKIIISVNLEFDPGLRMAVANQGSRLVPWRKPDSTFPPTVLDKAQEFWQEQFADRKAKGRAGTAYGNMRQFTLGSHHQKTLLIAGKRGTAQTLTGYCGMDLAGSVAGGASSWHDGCMRTRGDTALGLLDNFVDRWNFEIERLNTSVNFGVSAADQLETDTLWSKTGHPLADELETCRTMPVSVDWGSGTAVVAFQMLARELQTEILGTYHDMIDDAKTWLFLENQYFRHPEIADRLNKHLDANANLRVTLVLPAYSEEIGLRGDLPQLRDEYVAATTPAAKSALLVRAMALGLTIDPFNKVTLLMQLRCIANLVDHPRARIWIPRRSARKGMARPYIHTKLIAMDDSRLFVGSANVNGRSMDGYADSEINVLLTAPAEVQRIKARRKWQNEPIDQTDPRYLKWSATDPTPTYYARHNLVRYTKTHWEIDQAFAVFPVGKTAMLDYWEKFTKSASTRVDTWTPTMTRAVLSQRLDTIDALPGIDVETIDWGSFLIERTSHLL